MTISPLVSTAWLQQHLTDSSIRTVDCRWVLGEPGEGLRQYTEAHIPGAFHLDVDRDLSGQEGPGRHPLPAKRDFETLMRGKGISRDIHVVAYDGGQGMPAPRLWWLLRYFSHMKVSVLDGGWKRWTAEGRPVTAEVRQFPKADFVGRARLKTVLDKSAVDGMRDDPDVVLLDARAPERFRGETEPIDARAGHIPGAENMPYVRMLDPETGLFRSPGELKAEFEKVNASKAGKVICYCGSGITACTDILALHVIGIEAQLYEGSWSDWSRDASMAIATK